jgi:hypothetical protein
MEKKSKAGTIWSPTKSGVVVPGRVWDSTVRSTTNLVEVKTAAEAVEVLYADTGVAIAPACDLSALIASAKTAGRKMIANGLETVTRDELFRALHFLRVADAVLPLADEDLEQRRRYLEALTSGTFDFFNNDPSPPKDRFWELELWAALRRRWPSTSLQDPPDIVLRLPGGNLAIACKKIYSEANIEKNLSEAVAQVEGDYDVGIVAMNVDGLVPAGTFLRVDREGQMADKLQGMNGDFLRRNDRYWRKYLSTGRLVAAMACIHSVVQVREWRVPLNTASQILVWTIPGLSAEKSKLLDQFRELVG